MVIAGPGTGKTQILASRIGKILLETDSQPRNILCLTYTDAGVVAMRQTPIAIYWARRLPGWHLHFSRILQRHHSGKSIAF